MPFASPLRRTLSSFFLLSLIPLLTSCSDPVSSNDLQDLEEWTAELDLRIGSVDDPDYSLTWMRSVQVSQSGRMFSLHSQEQLIRVFGPDGNLEGTIGGRGDGPGEFQSLAVTGWVGDTLWALDFNGYRFSFFSEGGDFLSSFSVPFQMEEGPDSEQPPRASGLLSDGTIHGAPPAFSSQIEAGTITHHRVLLMTREGEVSDSVISIPFGKNQWAVYDPDNRRSGMLYGRQPFGDGPLWSFFPDEKALAILYRESPATVAEARFVLQKFTVDGDTLFSREYRYEPSVLTAVEADSVMAEQVHQWSERGALGGVTEARLLSWGRRTFYRPAFKTPITRMVIAKNGGFWLGGRPGPDETSEWYYLDPDGTPRGKVSLPTGLQVFTADSDTLWGSERDELDIPYIVRFRVNREE